MAAVEDVTRVGADVVDVERVMVGQQDDHVGRRELVRRRLDPRHDPVHGAALDHVRVGRAHVGPERPQQRRHPHRRGLPRVAGVLLVGQPEQQDARALDRQLTLVERHHQPVHNVIRHVTVDIVRELDEAEALAERPFHPPRQVRRVDRQAVPADARPGAERQVAERLGRRRLDRFPHVDAEVTREHGQLVHERDVDVPEGVLHQLGQLGLAR